MNDVLAILCARMSSTRLPGKALADLNGQPVLQWIIDRLNKAQCISKVVIATTTGSEDDPIVQFCEERSLPCWRGSKNNVVQRMNEAIKEYINEEEYIYRAMADQPFVDWIMLDEITTNMKIYDWDFMLPMTFTVAPIYGGAPSPWSLEAWDKIVDHSANDELEHPGMYARRHLWDFSYGLIALPHWMYRGHRLELDTPEDLSMFKLVLDYFEEPPELRRVVELLDANLHLSAMNAHVREKTGPFTSFTASEVAQWREDYINRPVIWQDMASIVALIQDVSEHPYRCDVCKGPLVAWQLKRKEYLELRCVRCKNTRRFWVRQRK